MKHNLLFSPQMVFLRPNLAQKHHEKYRLPQPPFREGGWGDRSSPKKKQPVSSYMSFINIGQNRQFPLDLFLIKHIILRNLVGTMNIYLFSLVLVAILAVLIIKDQFLIGMAKVRAK